VAYYDYQDPYFDPYFGGYGGGGYGGYSNGGYGIEPPAPGDPMPPTGPGPTVPGSEPDGGDPAPTPPAPSDPWDTAPGNGDWRSWFLANVGGTTPTPATLIGLEGKLGKHGIAVLRNAEGVAGKIRLPNGAIVDVIEAAGAGGRSWQWLTGGAGGEGGAGSGRAFSADGIDPAYLAPFTERPPTFAGVTPYVAPTPEFRAPADFVAPTADSLGSDPGYRTRITEGQRAIENAAASRGLLNSGGTLADLVNYSQEKGAQEYSGAWQRAFTAWASEWDNALREHATRGDNWDRGLNLWNTNQQAALSGFDRNLAAWRERRDTHYANQENPFSKIYRVANLGAMAAGA
jgi:hypothetical protein